MTPTFDALGVPASIRDALASRGITRPFEIQAVTIADALAGRDVCGRAPTGSGKTLAFGIPLVATVGRGAPGRPRGLVLAPTRELADQIAEELRSFADRVRIGVVYGGVGFGPQVQRMRKGVEILVACPGRLEDLIGQGVVDLRDVDQVVVDEADRMADMGFLPVVRRLLDQTAPERQTVLFSATLDGDVAKLIAEYQHDPARHEVGESTPDITSAEHRFWEVERTERVDATAQVIRGASPAIVFCRTRHGADRLARQLGQRGVRAGAIHGGHAQNRRTKTLAQFGDGAIQALIATDVAARGIHVDGVALVVHFDPPEDHTTYIHRSGRTARAGAGGLVVSMVLDDHLRAVRDIQRELELHEPIRRPDLTAAVRAPEVVAERADGEVRASGASTADREARHGGDTRRPGERSGERRRSGSPRPGGGKGRGHGKGRGQGRGQTGRSRPSRGSGGDGRSTSGRDGSGRSRGPGGGDRRRGGSKQQRTGGDRAR